MARKISFPEPTTHNDAVAAVIRGLMADRGLGYAELAAKADAASGIPGTITEQSLERYSTLKRGFPFTYVWWVARAFGLRPSELVARAEQRLADAIGEQISSAFIERRKDPVRRAKLQAIGDSVGGPSESIRQPDVK